jgi:hypothetical protein
MIGETYDGHVGPVWRCLLTRVDRKLPAGTQVGAICPFQTFGPIHMGSLKVQHEHCQDAEL